MSRKIFTTNHHEPSRTREIGSAKVRGVRVVCGLFLFSLSSFLILLACQNPFLPSETENPRVDIPAGKGAFFLSVTTNAGRTILPALNVGALYYTLVFTPSPTGAPLEENRDYAGLNAPFYLEAGTYSLEVTAYSDSNRNNLVAQGGLSGIVIGVGGSTNQSIALKAVIGSGTGTFAYSVTVPTGLTTATMVVTPLPSGSPQTVTFTTGTPLAKTGTLTLNTGYYNVVVTLEKEDETKKEYKKLVWSEILHVYAGLTSSYTQVFTNDDFYKTKYTVTFNINYTSGSPPPNPIFGEQSVFHGEAVPEPDPAPTRVGNAFLGWFIEQSGGEKYDFDNTPVMNDINLYAHWSSITISLNPTTLTLIKGNTETIIPTVYPTGTTLTWSSSDTNVATVNNGTVTAVGRGTATITAGANGVSASCTVTVDNAGTSADPYEIWDEADMLKIKKSQTGDWGTDKHYIVMDDIDMTQNWTPIGNNTTPFTGSFDGNNKTITGLRISAISSYKGMLGFISGDTAVVKNLSVDVTFTGGSNYVGGIAGYITASVQIVGCSVSGSIIGSNSAGGVVGYNDGGKVQNCYATVNVSCFVVGGVVGCNDGNGTVENCYATGNVSGSGTAGGVVGINTSGIVQNCYATGNVSDTKKFGGVTGQNDDSMIYCVALNLNITGTGTFGRVESTGSGLTNNYGRMDMQLNGSPPNPAWTNNVNGKDGANITPANWIRQTWWSNTTNGPGFDFSETGAWEWHDTNNLPILKGFPAGTQNPQVTSSGVEEDIEDFGPGAVIEDPFTVATTAEWNNALSIISDGGPDKNYIINVVDDFDVPGKSNTFGMGSATGIKVSLRGAGRTLALSGKGYMIHIAANRSQTVILRDLTLQGHSENLNNMVSVFSSGTFTMHSGEISGNNAGQYGGGVYVSGGTFTMHGGTISVNIALNGGGVFVTNSGTFTMNGGEISGNTATGSGGGVRVNIGTFTMNGGEISGNNATAGDNLRGGGGVSVYSPNATFTMNGGEISGNNANSGGGVNVQEGGTFTMIKGEISDNTAPSGGGVYNSGTFTMNNGKISGNTATGTTTTSGGGGVFVIGGTFTMHGGEISGNTVGSTARGGGVYVDSDGIFTMEGGTIGKKTSSDNGNEATNGGGVYVNTSGTFTMNDGTISGNTATGTTFTHGGGGVCVYPTSATFTMNGGEISGNTASTNGGGVFVYSEGSTFTMNDGTISGNTSNGIGTTNGGGGVCVLGGTFTMHDGIISGNTANRNGGGVHMIVGTFQIVTGTIYGSNEPNESLRNTATYEGTALNIYTGTVEHGRFDGTGGAWNPIGTLVTTNSTIRVVNGVLISGQTTANSPDDIADFGLDKTITIFTVSTIEEWEAAIAAIKEGGPGAAGSDKNYVINVPAGFTVTNPGTAATFGTVTGIKVSLRGSPQGGGGTLALPGAGILIHTAVGQTVILRDLTLKGNDTNVRSVVQVYGTFTMHSGEISGNTAVNGGGVYVASGTFTMNGGKISGNTATSGGTGGGGVVVNSNGTFIMNGGEISGNTAAFGGGVFLNGIFCLVTGTIYGNETTVEENLRNTATGTGAALYNAGGTAQHGTFSGPGGAWASSGNLATSETTIKVENGEIVQ